MHGFLMRLAVALSAILCLGCSKGGGAQSGIRSASDNCPSFPIEADGWRSAQTYIVGIEFRHPSQYERMFWEQRSDSLTRVAELRRREPPLSRVRFFDVRNDSASKLGPMRIPTALSCHCKRH